MLWREMLCLSSEAVCSATMLGEVVWNKGCQAHGEWATPSSGDPLTVPAPLS